MLSVPDPENPMRIHDFVWFYDDFEANLAFFLVFYSENCVRTSLLTTPYVHEVVLNHRVAQKHWVGSV